MTKEDREKLVAVFEWLLKEDKKQNPQNYTNFNKENVEISHKNGIV